MTKQLNVIQPKVHIHPSEVVKDISARDLEGLNVVFINMPLRETAVPNNTPEGPLLMATNLRQNYGVNATVIDLNAYRIQDEEAKRKGLENGRYLSDAEARRLIEKHCRVHGKPVVVALSGIITTLGWQKKAAKMVKEIMPEALLVSGGGLATGLRPTQLNPKGLFGYVPELDAIAHSDGDDVILKIVRDAKAIREKGWLSALANGELKPYYYADIDGRSRLVYEGDRPRNLDAFPWADLSLLKEDANGYPILEKYLKTPVWGDPRTQNSSATDFWMERSTTSVSSRGCPYNCIFCYRGTRGEKKQGLRSAQHLYREIKERVEKHGIDFNGYLDENFAVTKGRVSDMAVLFRELKETGIHWGTHTRLDEAAGLIPKPGGGKEFVLERPLRVQLMAEAGCRYIGFGPESASGPVLEALGKGGFTLHAGFMPVSVGGEVHWFPKAMVLGIMHTMLFGIHSNCTWIMGSPTETLEELKKTVRFILWQIEYYGLHGIPPSAINQRMFTLTWYPGTKMIRHPKVRQRLSEVFGLTFVKVHPTKEEYEPVFDENFEKYCLKLGDATKVLYDSETGQLLHFSDMADEEFIQARTYVDSGQLFRILDM